MRAPVAAHVRLREGTREAHESTEATGGMRRLMAGELDETGYAALLHAQLNLFDEWETRRAAWLAQTVHSAGWDYVSRAALLRADLAVTGRADFLPGSIPTESDTDLLPGSSASTVGTDPIGDSMADEQAVLWGELYVIEGSALGGRLIVRRLRELYPGRLHRFYAVGEDAPAAWRGFQHVLDTQLGDEAARAAAVVGANRMFARFRQTLKDPPAHG